MKYLTLIMLLIATPCYAQSLEQFMDLASGKDPFDGVIKCIEENPEIFDDIETEQIPGQFGLIISGGNTVAGGVSARELDPAERLILFMKGIQAKVDNNTDRIAVLEQKVAGGTKTPTIYRHHQPSNQPQVEIIVPGDTNWRTPQRRNNSRPDIDRFKNDPNRPIQWDKDGIWKGPGGADK